MSFLLKKVASKLRRNAAAYVFLILEFSLGISFLVFARNGSLSVQGLQDYYDTHYTPTTVSISPNPTAGNADGELSITPEDVEYVQRQFPQAEMRYQVMQPLDFLQNGQVKRVYVLYCDQPEFGKDEAIALAGRNAMDLLQSGGQADLGKMCTVDENSLALNGGTFSVEPLPKRLGGEKNTVFPISVNAFFSLEDAILLPVWQKDTVLPKTGYAMLEWDIAGQESAQKKLGKIQETLLRAHGESYSYEIQYPQRFFERSVSDGLRLQSIAGKLGVLMFLELLIGFSGLMLLFMKKREKELAICLAMGAKRRTLAGELFLEIGVVCGLGAAIGVAAGNAMTRGANNPEHMLQIQVHASAALPAILAAILVTAISAAPMLHKIYTAEPDRILRGET